MNPPAEFKQNQGSQTQTIYLQDSFDCKCKGDIHHHLVTPKGRYGFWAWLALMTGISAKPQKIYYHCTLCRKDIATTDDASVLKQHY